MITTPGGEPDAPTPADKTRRRRRAAGIYGAIVTAAIMAATGEKLSTTALVVAVLVTLIVYWIAEEYAELLADQVEDGRLPTWSEVGQALAATWPMVSASFLPLAVLVISRLLGASTTASVNIGLVVAVVLLIAHGWSAGRAANLHGRQLAAVTSLAAALGVAMIVLKNLVLLHLH